MAEAPAAALAALQRTEFPRDLVVGQQSRHQHRKSLVRGERSRMPVSRFRAGLPLTRYSRFTEGVRLWYPVQDCVAFRDMRRAGQLTTMGWLASLAHRQHFPVFAVNDPGPALAGLRSFPRRFRARHARTSAESSDPAADF